MEVRPGQIEGGARRRFSHDRRDCPIAGCVEHRWPRGMTRRDLGQYRQAHEANAASHEVAKLVDVVNRLVQQGDQQRSKSKYDGRRVIEDGKRRRRELIGQVARYGLNGL